MPVASVESVPGPACAQQRLLHQILGIRRLSGQRAGGTVQRRELSFSAPGERQQALLPGQRALPLPRHTPRGTPARPLHGSLRASPVPARLPAGSHQSAGARDRESERSGSHPSRPRPGAGACPQADLQHVRKPARRSAEPDLHAGVRHQAEPGKVRWPPGGGVHAGGCPPAAHPGPGCPGLRAARQAREPARLPRGLRPPALTTTSQRRGVAPAERGSGGASPSGCGGSPGPSAA
jgi:hypothetical protein